MKMMKRLTMSSEIVKYFLLAILCICASTEAKLIDEYGDGDETTTTTITATTATTTSSKITLEDLDDRLRRVEELLTRHSASTAKILDRILKTLDGSLPKCSPANPCLHGGRCVEMPEKGDFECVCQIGFSGKRCEKCADGFVEDAKDGSCKPDGDIFAGMFGKYKSSSYLIGKHAKSWDMAREDCQRLKGGDLASMETMEEWIYVWQKLRQADGEGVHFLGAKGNGKTGWNWLSGKGSALHHQAWRYGKPSSSGGHCLLSLEPTGYSVMDLWINGHCDDQRGFLCEFPTP